MIISPLDLVYVSLHVSHNAIVCHENCFWILTEQVHTEYAVHLQRSFVLWQSNQTQTFLLNDSQQLYKYHKVSTCSQENQILLMLRHYSAIYSNDSKIHLCLSRIERETKRQRATILSDL